MTAHRQHTSPKGFVGARGLGLRAGAGTLGSTLGSPARHDAASRWAAITLLACCVTFAACGESQDPSSGAAPTVAAVTRSERVWVDATRPTARNGEYAGAPDRTLRTLLWQPATPRPLPLFVMAHGFGGLPEKFDAMARTIAGAGFVVAAPAFPLTNQNAPGNYLHGLLDVANQPADVGFVIAKLIDANAMAGDPLYRHLITGDIAVLGHSLGGATTIALTREDCCRDDRVRASVLVDAAPISLFTNLFGTGSIAAGPPTLVLHGTQDPTIAYATSQQLYSDIDPPKIFVGITGAHHSDAIEAQTEPLTGIQSVSERAIVAFLNALFNAASADLSSTLATLAAEGNSIQNEGSLP
jgi:predicted dienelactone hydrolase